MTNTLEAIRKALEPMGYDDNELYGLCGPRGEPFYSWQGALTHFLNDKSQTGARFKDVMFGNDGLDEITIDTHSDRATFQLHGRSSAIVNCDDDVPFGPVGAIDIDELSVKVWLQLYSLKDPRGEA